MSGPLFETTTDHLIISPKSGAVLFTYFLTKRSALEATSILLFTILLVKLQSYSFPAISAILTSFPVLLTKQIIVNSFVWLLSNLPTFQVPLNDLSILINPSGKISQTTTPVAVSGPLLVTLKVHSTKELNLGLVSLTNFSIAKSAHTSTSMDWLS